MRVHWHALLSLRLRVGLRAAAHARPGSRMRIRMCMRNTKYECVQCNAFRTGGVQPTGREASWPPDNAAPKGTRPDGPPMHNPRYTMRDSAAHVDGVCAVDRPECAEWHREGRFPGIARHSRLATRHSPSISRRSPLAARRSSLLSHHPSRVTHHASLTIHRPPLLGLEAASRPILPRPEARDPGPNGSAQSRREQKKT